MNGDTVSIEEWQWERLMEVLWAIHTRLEDINNKLPERKKDEAVV